MRAWLTLGITALWLAVAFSFAYWLAAPLSKDVAPFIVFVTAMLLLAHASLASSNCSTGRKKPALPSCKVGITGGQTAGA